ncbi:hypothetical protein HYS85_00915 [Candidatus Saccharibacteria bacterium]|nr:hypothetical protein [Candidatus Saccharibacteria bacterium]
MNKHKNAEHLNGHKWRRRARRLVRFLADNSPLPEIMFISTFILIRWWNNSDFSYPSEIFLPIISFAVLVTFIFYIYRFILGAGIAAHAAALALSYLLYVFQFVEGTRTGKFIYSLIPDNLSTPFIRSLILAIVFGLFFGVLAWLASKLIDRFGLLKQLQLYKVMLFAVVFIFSIQLVRTGARLVEIRHQLGYKYPVPVLSPSVSQTPSNKPDIYYLVFDRYTSPEVLKENFNFDNSAMVNFLQSQGFVTRQNAYSNYAFTMSSIASTMAMDYFPQLEKSCTTLIKSAHGGTSLV